MTMSLLGFKEAHENSITVRISSAPKLDIQLPSIPGLAIMKIISWDEKYPARKKRCRGSPAYYAELRKCRELQPAL